MRLALHRGPTRARSRGQWILFGLGWTALGVAVAGLAWVLVTGLLARSHLHAVRADLPKLRAALTAGDMPRARSVAADITRHAARAHELSSGPAWWVTANLPVAGSPLRTARTLATQADRVSTQVLPAVVDLAQDVADMPHLRDSTIDIDRLTEAEPTLHRAAIAAHAAAQAVSGTPGSWLGTVSHARDAVESALADLDDELAGADRTLRVLLPMLGQSGTQRYFIGFMNEAESRGLGGIPGAFAIVTADRGTITFTHFGSDDELRGVRAKVDLGSDFDALYKQDDPTGVIQNSDLSPDFTYAARIWAGMWQAKTGQLVDGAIAVDPTALSYLLKVTGSARLADGSTVSAANVVALTQQKQYEMYGSESAGDTAERKAYLSGIAKVVADKLTTGGDGPGLLRALSKAAGERRLLVWSARPALEKLIQDGNWAGTLDPTLPITGFVVNNAAGGKLDYYLDRTLTYRRNSCSSPGTATAEFTVSNRAPASGLPQYVTIRADKPRHRVRPGDNHLLITYYGTRGAVVDSVSMDGQTVPVVATSENGFVVVTVDVELPVGSSRTIRVNLREPATSQPIQVLKQPLVRPLSTDVRTSCTS